MSDTNTDYGICCICIGPLATPEEKELFKTSKHGFMGNNAYPVMDGRCCTNCDNTVVIPTRIRRMLNRERNA